VQRGDLWQLGAHRLLCGDSTDAGDVTRLMAGALAHLCLTDPPYNVGLRYEGAYAGQDNKTPAAYGKWLRRVIELAETHLEHGALVFVWQAMANAQHYHKWFAGRNWRIFASCKNFVQLRRGGWMEHAWEPVICWQHGSTKRRSIIRDWHIGITSNTKATPDRRIRGEHPCPRPLDTVTWLCEQATAEGALVYDAFLGSGTTMLACEQSARRCYGVEIEPRYCDIILRRWEQATGQRAMLLERPGVV
jgi:DNA modification methylase